MTRRYALTQSARRDLQAIDRYYVREAGIATADRILDIILTTLDRCATWPQSGPLRPEIVPGIRSAPAAGYMIYFRPRPHGDGIQVMRVIHGARDQAAAFVRQRERVRQRNRPRAAR